MLSSMPQILGMQLITHQTGPHGQKVQRLLIEETAAIDREPYLGIVLDVRRPKLVFMASQAGGMEIGSRREDLKAIHKAYIDPAVGFSLIRLASLLLRSAEIDADHPAVVHDGPHKAYGHRCFAA